MKRILVALDQSLRSRSVLEQASVIARATGAELTLFHAVGIPVGVPAEAFRASPGELLEQWRTDAIRDLGLRAKAIDPALKTHTLVRIGSPWSAICEAAREQEVDLVVVGSHGYDALDHVIGTTAAKVVNHCDRSVLVVREPQKKP
jgi:nucleotide-binding universal stress UspA family protein